MYSIKLCSTVPLMFLGLLACTRAPSPSAPQSSSIQEGQESGGVIKPSPVEPVSRGGRILTPEEYEAREKMLEGTHLPGPMPPPGPDAPKPVGPEKGTETIPR